jgi:spore germination protein KA
LLGTSEHGGESGESAAHARGPAATHTGSVSGDNPETAEPLSGSREANVAQIRKVLGNPPDLAVRELSLGTGGQVAVAVIALTGMSDADVINENILKSATLEARADLFDAEPAVVFDRLRQLVLTVTTVLQAATLAEVADQILGGDTAVLVDGHPVALICDTAGFKMREIGEPITEGLVRGPREAFTENLATNVTLLRRKIRSPRLRFHELRIGAVSQTRVTVAHIDGIARPDIIDEVFRRLNGIRTDAILESGYIEEFLEDHPASWFPQIDHTERPDKVAAALLEGRVAILTNNTPFALIVPTVFIHFLQSSEDYYERSVFATAVRLVRVLGIVVAVVLPAAYVAVITIHQEILPLALVLSVAGSREGNPFPALIEAVIMEAVFELLREAGVRLPRPVGQAVSIVGGLVIGEAAVRAGIASPAMVVVVAVTGIANFSVPAFSLALTLRLLRFLMMLLAALMGIPGITLAALAVLGHMAALRSFGVPYLSPIAPARYGQWLDVLVRAPRWAMSRRPAPFAQDRVRQEPAQKPMPPRQNRSEKGG